MVLEILTDKENSRLSELEGAIRKGINAFYEMGKALAEIRDRRLYKKEFTNFEDYCESKWTISKPYAHRLIQSHDVINNLSPIGTIPTTETQARPLASLKNPEDQVKVWKAILEKHGSNITASIIQEEVTKFRAQTSQQAKENVSLEQRIVTYLNPHYMNLFTTITKHEGATEAELARKFIKTGIDTTDSKYKRPI